MLTDLFISEIDDQYFIDEVKFCDFKHDVHNEAALHKNVTLRSSCNSYICSAHGIQRNGISLCFGATKFETGSSSSKSFLCLFIKEMCQNAYVACAELLFSSAHKTNIFAQILCLWTFFTSTLMA